MATKLKFVYRNHKGEIEERIIVPEKELQFWGNRPEYNPAIKYHPDGGWMLSGICQTRQARRTFELRRIIGPITEVD